MNAYAATAYRQSVRAGLRPAELVAMLLQRAGEHMTSALAAHDAGDFESRFHRSDAARVIILALRENLDTDNPAAAEMSKTYDAYYATLTRMIDKFNIEGDRDAGAMVRDGAAQLAQAWREIAAPSAPQSVQPTAGAALSA